MRGSRSGGKYVSRSQSIAVNSMDKLDLSARVYEIQRIRSLAQDSPDIREDLVSGIEKEIEEGRYAVSGVEIAQKIIFEHRLDASCFPPNSY